MTNEKSKLHNGLTYKDAGVDISEGNTFVDAIKPLVKSTKRPGSDTDIGGFGGLFDLKACGFKDPVLVAANDGVGTKIKIAIESGIHNTVGIDLVAMCVNDIVVQGAEPLFFLDYLAVDKLESERAKQIIEGITEGCRQAGCALIGGETAEMPGLYATNDYDLAGFCVGAAERNSLLPKPTVKEGDIILGLSSSGFHSNGFSLVRKVVEIDKLNYSDPAPFDPDVTLAEALLEPTRIYVKPVLETIRRTRAIKAIAHITGGGFIENIPRVLPENLVANIDLGSVEVPAVFKWLSATANIAQEEMIRTFNCGIGMVLICDENDVQTLSDSLIALGENVTQLGHISKENHDIRLKANGSLMMDMGQ